MAYSVAEQTLLMGRLAQKHRIEMTQLQSYTLVQLRELWRILETASDAEKWARAARNGFNAVVKAQTTNGAVLSGAVMLGSGEIYKASGRARKGFTPSPGDQTGFVAKTLPTIQAAAEREMGYHLSRAVRGEIPRAQAVRQMAGVAQMAQLNASREYITQEALASPDVPVSEEPVPLKERYAPQVGSRDASEHFAIEETPKEILTDIGDVSEDVGSWLDEDFIEAQHEDDSSWLDEDFGLDEAEAEFIGWEEDPLSAVDQDLIEEWKKEQTKPAAVKTDVRSGGCDYCKIVGIGKGPHKWHKNCNCINLPAWDQFEYGAPPWEDEMLDRYYAARAIAETYVDTANGYVTMDDIMRELRVMDAAAKNKERVAQGLKPRKIHDRAAPKTMEEKLKIRARNAARVQRLKDAGKW